MMDGALPWLLVGVSVGLSLAVGILVGADRGLPAALRAVLIALAVSGAAYSLLVVAGRLEGGLAPPYRTSLVMLSAPGAALLWLGVRLLFDDDFRLRPAVLWPVAFLALVPLTRFVWEPPRALVPAIIAAVAGALGVHLVWRLVRGRGDDLDDYRRRFRWLFAGAGSAYLLVAVVVTLFMQRDGRSVAFGLAFVLAQIAIKIGLLALIAGRPSPLARLTVTGFAAPGAVSPRPGPAVPEPATAVDVAPILAAMEQSRLYRETGLSIGGLARHVRLPEHRVRQLINQALGYRNFNAFLNHYRLREVAARLKDPGDARLPILTLALEAGYGSIGPFNRAFRDAYGVTPTSYRRGDAVAGVADSS